MPLMEAPPIDCRAVEATVASLQERLADGDPADAALRSHCEVVLLALRAAYRVNPAVFSREAIEALCCAPRQGARSPETVAGRPFPHRSEASRHPTRGW